MTIGLGTYLFTWAFGPHDGTMKTLARWIILAAALFVLVVWVIRPFLFWFSTHYVFTNRRIIIRTGILAKKGRDMPLSKLNNVSFSHTVIERFLNCGTLMVESAGEQGELIIANVPNVEIMQREIYRLHEEDDERRRMRLEHPQQGYPQQSQSSAPPLPDDGT